MAQGLVVYRADGSVLLNTSDRITRYVGSYSYNISGSTQASVYVPGCTNDGTWFAFVCLNPWHWATIGSNYVYANRLSNNSYWGDTGSLLVFRG